MLIVRYSDIHQLSFISCWKVSQGDVTHCPRPSVGGKYQFFKDNYLGSAFTVKGRTGLTIGHPPQREERTLENLSCPRTPALVT